MLVCAGMISACSGPKTGGGRSESETDRVFYLHLQMTEDKEEAVRVRDQAEQWWVDQPSTEKPSVVDRGSSSETVTIKWKPPLYRVRLGPFDSREKAESILETARSSFPDAFVAPARIQTP